MRFVVYKHSLILGDNNIVTKQLIALKHDDGTLQFTDFHRYVKSTAKINTQLFSKSNLVHCLLTVDFKTLFSSPRITS